MDMISTAPPPHHFLAILCVLFWVMLFVVLWIVPIPLGIGCAIRKHYSPYWMWFGLHPLGGWIALVVLASLPARVVCGHCGGYVGGNFCLCPYCHAPLGPTGSAAAAHTGEPAGQDRTEHR
jgi:hypothetical protein